ncbi:hypothetical protein FTO74_06265 [Granulicella sp. WH15]|uniref:hypothetical protein n=1 Tax=Granulicella sp. WH15 TaxID=2602070 RepID=UPI001366B2DE|nr:hypothetical protein [Granulicella sp. WH15]QHN03019.1 hypothetical protein FTO74_06265 [Granulicella sp. WH15]
MNSAPCRLLCLSAATLLLAAPSCLSQATELGIDHHFQNTDAQSLIGLPMGSHKTTVEKDGSLKWSQWSLKRKPLDVPIGFSSQMDGALAIEPFATGSGADTRLKTTSQTLYKGRYPFIVSKLTGGGLTLEELAFSADPEADPAVDPRNGSGTRGLDLIKLTFTNEGSAPQSFALKLSGRERNLPGHVTGHALISGSGEDVALVADNGGATETTEDNGLTLNLKATLAPRQTKTIWLRVPYEWSAKRNSELTTLSGDALLQKAAAQWDGIWSRGTRIHYPQQVLNDFFDSSLAYVLILTEYDAQGDLWALDGPDVYRQYWGRGEYFQARALEVAGHLAPARESIEHAFRIMIDDGEWDGPPTSGFPAWDNTGGNAGAVWDYYLYTRDKTWLAKAYPYLLKSSEWIHAHREETQLENVAGIPTGAKPIHRMLTGAKCRPEPEPELKPGEKTYWYGLLPWSYGDSGLPEGHSYSHNFLAAYGVRVSAEAARALGRTEDAAWLDKEYSSFAAAIRASVERSVTLEKISPAYLPAQPTRPDAAYSQTFLGIWPTGLYSPNDPLVTGLLTRMEKEEVQGLPTNVAWAGPAGVWPGEAMNMSETYLLRDDAKKNAEMLIAALNHSYTTNVFKEEILTDVTRERACDTPHSKRQNMEGTGDMPEAWGNANAVDLLRDNLVQERTEMPSTIDSKTTLHLLPGLLPEWISKPGDVVSIDRTPTTLGTTVSLKLERTSATAMHLSFAPGANALETVIVHLPVPEGATLKSVTVDGSAAHPAGRLLTLHHVSKPTTVTFEFAR